MSVDRPVHSPEYRRRRFQNWFPLGLTYATFYMSTSICAPPRAIECVAASITATVRRACSGVTASASFHARWSARFL